MSHRLRVLLTGAEGVIGTVLRGPLGEAFEVRCLTRGPAQFPSHTGDISRLESIQDAFVDIEAVILLAGESSVDAGWTSVLDANVIGTYNVFEAARRTGVRRVVFASSNHAVGMYEATGAPGIYDLDDQRVIDETAPVRPDSLYGVSKVVGESIGRLYSDRYGIDVICLRIGSIGAVDDPEQSAAGRPFDAWPVLTARESRARRRAVWLSHRDCVQLFHRALTCDARWAVVFGTSDNPRQMWDLTGAREVLGYVPQDGAPAELGSPNDGEPAQRRRPDQE